MNLYGDLLRGHTDAIILSVLKDKDSYGYEINQTIRERSNGHFELTEATLYTAFKRLEQQGLISSYWMDGINQVKRKYYSLTNNGKSQLEEKILAFKETTKILEVFLK